MNILVLGASGLVGWNLLQVAKSHGHQATGTYGSHVLPDLLPLRMEKVDAAKELFAKLRPDAVFYCAGWSWVDGCEGDPARAYRENSEYPAKLGKYATEGGCRFVYFSTSYVFDGLDGPYNEQAKPRPLSVYGQSKLQGEWAVSEATAGNAIIARTMGVYGLEPQEKNFVYQVIRTLSAGKTLRVPNDQFGNVTYAPDLALMAIELVRQGQNGIWNLAGPDALVRRSDLAKSIAQSYELPQELIVPVETSLLQQPARRPRQGGLRVEKVVLATRITPRPWEKLLQI